MTLGWDGRAALHVGLIHYVGPAGDNAAHRHAALQIVLSEGRIVAETGVFQAPLYIRPMAEHRLEPSARVELFLIEPASKLGQRLLRDLPESDIGDLAEHHVNSLRDIDRAPGDLPPALANALEYLSGEDAMQKTITDAAALAGVSVSGLRALSQRILGVNLSRWRLWQALQDALAHLAAGERAAYAAHAAGFSDQAHLTRSMKQTLGLTPGAVQQASAQI